MNDQASWWAPVTLSGPTLTLSPMRLRDAPDYLQALGSAEESAEVVQHLTFRPPTDLSEARLIISAAVGDATLMPYVQRITETGELVGTTSFYEIDESLRALAIGSTWIVSVPNSALTSSTWLMQASTVLPFARQAQEPQMADRHEYRTARLPSCSSWRRRIASRSVMSPSCSSSNVWR